MTKTATSLFTPRYFLLLTLVYLAHFGSALLGMRVMSNNGIVAAFWPPSGIALAALLVGGLRFAPAIIAGALSANLFAGCPLHVSAIFATANLLEALTGYALLKKQGMRSNRLDHATDFFKIFLLAGMLAPIPSALIGSSTLAMTGLTQDSWRHNLQFWWMGDSLGVIFFTPLILIWRQLEKWPVRPIQIYEGVLAAALAFAAGQVIFVGWYQEYLPVRPPAFFMFIFVVWTAIRFGRHVTLILFVMIIAQVLVGMVKNAGYFASTNPDSQFMHIWLYMAILSVSGMSLATFIHERKKSLNELSEVTASLERLSATAHVGGWELDLATMRLAFSTEALRIVEVEPGRNMGVEEAIDFIAPEFRDAHRERVRAAVEERRAWDVEFGMQTATGRQIWVRSQGYPVIRDNRVVRLTGTVHDLSDRQRANHALQESNERLRQIFATLSEGVTLNQVVLDEQGEMVDHRIIEVNDAFYRIADYDKNYEVIGGLASQLYHLNPETTKQFWDQHKDAKETSHIEFFSQLSRRHFIISTSPVRNGYFVSSFFDITERKNMEIALRESEERHRQLVESSADAILVHQGGVIVYVNPAAVRILKAPGAAHLVNSNIREIVPLESRAIILENRSTPSPLREGQFRCYDDTLVDVEVSTAETVFIGITSTMIIARDISERREAEEQIRYLGQHDILTGLPNRGLFADRLSQTIALAAAHKSIFALLFLDIDHFKKINDSLGHHHGDLLLKETTKRLLKCVKEIDTVSRQGGDEFIILLSELSHAEDAAQVAQKICTALTETVVVEKNRLNTSVSIGIAVYPRDGTNPETLIKNADIAMYHAKDSGRNQFQFFSEELNRITHENLELEVALGEAIRMNQLRVYYQPQLNLKTGRIESCEALLRWIHPTWGNIPPGRFIPLAEESGQISEIGRFVLDTVAENHRALREAGYGDLRISINASAEEIQNPDFSARIRDKLASGTMPAGSLELEVTESMIMQDTAKAIQTIRELSELGVKFSIDDFGTGYSSLSYLRQLKIHNLKIDQSFVRDLLVDADDAAIVRTIIGLAKNLRLQVTAEGVETVEQRAFLKENGCDIIQGFEFSEALPFTKFLLFLNAHDVRARRESARQKKEKA